MIDAEVNGMGLGPVNRLMTRWTFDATLLKTAPSVEQMRAFVAQTPLGSGRPVK